ncbi:hypothetical protein [Mycobacterium tuberculosis]|uniref:hypothetical protein n=1 Tax=Mycobacterium tuberculosis TaxID=1773 RepID=UPI0004F29B10|nr:hypothetical protein [Mycobacterium tuberculosis]
MSRRPGYSNGRAGASRQAARGGSAGASSLAFSSQPNCGLTESVLGHQVTGICLGTIHLDAMQWPWSSAYRLEPAVATTLIGISAWWANGSVKQYAGDLTDRVATMTVCRRTPAPRVHYRQ